VRLAKFAGFRPLDDLTARSARTRWQPERFCGRFGTQIGELDISLRSMRRRKLSSECRVRETGLTASMNRFFRRLLGDITFLRGVWRVIRRTSPIARNPTRILPLLIDDLAVRHGDKPALVSNRERLTYRMLAARSCRYARWAMAQGIRKGDVVGLLMTNRPEYVAIWLGIIRAGGTVALLNTNLTGPALAFCIDSVAPKHIIAAGDLAGALSSSAPYRKTAPRIWLHGEVPPPCPPPQAGEGFHSLSPARGGGQGGDRQP
jgi:non-ribosomal peptide synthetase component F